ncbi:alpha/beta fold hydrolase [Streptomyces zagrosensis]|uniref:Pimeloyl-ACP methyl ester carboxylesterase n=1 Tax=Streptomyces zagrosensis TaxID=1042984 RepID=A0A7W9UYP4_9ACTN|nr:alpha/beta hydrolase [Streptomyces zagrosensis]MBB5935897.1 pimeloyl-ACP methyl ester carboxylesterase [Streptomyces zagrosensis]
MTSWALDRTYLSSAGTVRWAELGAPDAPPVILLHGTPFSSYVWRGVARSLADRYRVLVWDMPGYGTSDRHEGQDVSLASQASVFVELLAHWGLHPGGADESPQQAPGSDGSSGAPFATPHAFPAPYVIAHDFGGCVALRAHLLHGAPYRALALVDPVALAPWGSASYRLLGDNAEVFGQLPPSLHRALLREYVSSASAHGLHPAVLDRLVEPWCGDAGQPAFYRQIAQNDQRYTDEIQGRYGELRLPVLVCWGTDDAWIPVAKAHELASLIPGARLRLIEGAGHLVQEDAPAELTGALTGFLHGLDD